MRTYLLNYTAKAGELGLLPPSEARGDYVDLLLNREYISTLLGVYC
jgi:hypothetical protein